jgi:hypothetical protein
MRIYMFERGFRGTAFSIVCRFDRHASKWVLNPDIYFVRAAKKEGSYGWFETGGSTR